MNLSRRRFLQLVGASVVAVTVLPKDIRAIPKIWADGVNYDDNGLRALFKGEVFEWMSDGDGPAYTEDAKTITVDLCGGTYHLSPVANIKDREYILDYNGNKTFYIKNGIFIDHRLPTFLPFLSGKPSWAKGMADISDWKM